MTRPKSLDQKLVLLSLEVRTAATKHAEDGMPNLALKQACYSARKRLLEAERILAETER